jgi:hypothetical protein
MHMLLSGLIRRIADAMSNASIAILFYNENRLSISKNGLACMGDPLRFPKPDRLPAPRDGPDPLPVAGRQMINQLVDRVYLYTKDATRIRNLRLMKVRGKSAISEVIYSDRSEVEMLLWHRDKAITLEEKVTKNRKVLEDIPFTEESMADRAAALGHLDHLEEKSLKHVAAMEKILENLSKEQMGRENLMAKLASDAAKLVQASVQHEDKMELAREGGTEKSQDELIAKMAAKYNITPEEVLKMLSAKGIDITGTNDA